ncbi:MAG: hypothetical protein E7Z79_09300 [Methanobrevibacter thaueri]|jgi:hypothetical protein|uniref:PAP2 superfamily protein n=1 Tax=Methanobrevibacter thaueri TaxID=190975 RepID=A0A8T3VAB7_9EURY|nr:MULTISPECIES: hypothetical protein [Methanobrevibacter]MBE6491270.1 hypothetical protein [Methanobrevibacter sp.]MBE6502616.1 hypothetical protein [Methanobrevibacter thaueri]
MNKLKIAKPISTFTNPPIICIPLFLIICLTLSFADGSFDLVKFITLEIVSLIFASILPMAIILFWAKRLGTDKDISNRSDRYMPLIVGIISYFIGFLVCLLFNLDNFLTCLLLCYSVNTGVVLIITTKWKISVHTTGLSGPNAALILLLGSIGALIGILYPLIIWSRVLLKKHTLAQAISGGVQGYFLTVLEMYLFSFILKLPLLNIVSLYDSILYILAIIITPIILGVLSYTNKSRVMFIILEIIALALFLAFTPLNVFIVFLIVSLASIFISLYAGNDFVWFEVLN